MPDVDDGSLWAWEALRPEELGEVLREFDRPWWVCGGWAIDLFLGRETRRHDDIDVAILRRDQAALYASLDRWDLRFATPEHQLHRWRGNWLEPPIHGVWARREDRAEAAWTCEFLMNEAREDVWLYRRNENISLRLDTIGLRVGDTPYFRPEVVLLFKSKDRSPKNDTDLVNTLPALSADAVNWLRDALQITEPEHPWISRLAAAR